MCAGVVDETGQRQLPDVGKQQVRNLLRGQCHAGSFSGMTITGRVRPIIKMSREPVCAVASGRSRKIWSRECRKACASFWFWQWFRPSQLAPRRPNRPQSRLFRKLPTRASTDYFQARARRHLPGGPAPTLPLTCLRAVTGSETHNNSRISSQRLWALAQHSPIRPAKFQDRSQDKC